MTTIPEKSTKNSIGVQVMTLKKGRAVKSAQTAQDAQIEGASRRRAKSIPARGTPLKAENIATQMTLE